MFDRQLFAAFTSDGAGGNEAGVVIIPPDSPLYKGASTVTAELFPEDEVMLNIASEVGFSETVFAVSRGDDWRVRYFSPEQEVDFCGHATIALGAAFGRGYGSGKYDIELNKGKKISVTANEDGSATLTSPETHSRPLDTEIENAVMASFGLNTDDIDPAIGTRMANAGNDHVLIGLKSRDRLAEMKYDFDSMQALMREHTIVTIALLVRENADVFHVRNAFAFGGVVEDPATGAAAAAIAGYLREAELVGFNGDTAKITLHQGDDMGKPCRIYVNIPRKLGSGIELTGYVRDVG